MVVIGVGSSGVMKAERRVWTVRLPWWELGMIGLNFKVSGYEHDVVVGGWVGLLESRSSMARTMLCMSFRLLEGESPWMCLRG